MTRGPRRRLPATLTALTLLAACALLAIGAIQMLAGEPTVISYTALARAAHSTHWNDAEVAIAAGVATVLGFILLLAAIVPGRPTVLPLSPADTDSPMDSGVSRRSLRNTLRSAANSVDGITRTTLTLRRRAVTATARTHRTSTDGLADAVRGAIEHRLDQISPATRPILRVRVTTTRSAP